MLNELYHIATPWAKATKSQINMNRMLGVAANVLYPVYCACRLVAQPRHAPKYGPIAQLGERSVRIREVKGSNPSRSTNLPHRFVRCGVFYA